MRVYIYGKTGCPNCEKAKALCENNALDYDYRLVGVNYTVEELIEKVGGDVRSVPQIFISEDGFHQYIGGYADFNAYLNRL